MKLDELLGVLGDLPTVPAPMWVPLRGKQPARAAGSRVGRRPRRGDRVVVVLFPDQPAAQEVEGTVLRVSREAERRREPYLLRLDINPRLPMWWGDDEIVEILPACHGRRDDDDGVGSS